MLPPAAQPLWNTKIEGGGPPTPSPRVQTPPPLPPLPRRLKKFFSSAFGATVLCVSWTTKKNFGAFGARTCRTPVGKEVPPPVSALMCPLPSRPWRVLFAFH